MNCDLCWEVVNDSDVDAEFESGDLVMCYKCRTGHGEDLLFGKF